MARPQIYYLNRRQIDAFGIHNFSRKINIHSKIIPSPASLEKGDENASGEKIATTRILLKRVNISLSPPSGRLRRPGGAARQPLGVWGASSSGQGGWGGEAPPHYHETSIGLLGREGA